MLLLNIIVAVAVIWLAVSFGCFCFTFVNIKKRRDPYVMPKGDGYDHARARMNELIDQMRPIPFEWICMNGLWARYYHLRDGAPLQIQAHGYKGCALRDFCGGNKLARETGMNTLVIDQRAHGRSRGRVISFGEREWKDVCNWAELMADRLGRDTPIILSGVSMGATTVLLCADKKINANIVGIIADCPFSNTVEIIQKVSKDMGLPPKLVMPFIRTGARLFGGLRLDADARKTAANSRVPILLIHGEADRFVPCQMSRDIFAAAPDNVWLETFPGAGHGLSFIEDFDRYRKAEESFCDQVLSKNKSAV